MSKQTKPNPKYNWLKDVVVLEMCEEVSGRIELLQGTKLQTVIRGKIYAMGKKFRFKDDVKLGDIVFVSDHFGTIREIDGKIVRVFDGEDILGVETK